MSTAALDEREMSAVSVAARRRLDAAEEQENQHDDQDQPNSARWCVTPVLAVRPARQNAKKRHY